MIKSILYTKNPPFDMSFEEITRWAEENNCYYTCLLSEHSPIYGVKPGSHILTTKNNDLYVLETSFRRNAFDFAKSSSITTIVEMD